MHKNAKFKHTHKVGDVFQFIYHKDKYVIGVVKSFSDNDEFPYTSLCIEIGVNKDGEMEVCTKESDWTFGDEKNEKEIINALDKIGKRKEVELEKALKTVIDNAKNKNITKIISKLIK